jgi:soluble lytic murein transglycosylase
MNPVYRRGARILALCTFLGAVWPLAAVAQSFESTLLEAREAFRKKDRNRLAALKAQAIADANPFEAWIEYWELNVRLSEAQQPELSAFAQRHAGSYVEDRLRNDWLLELGRRRDWANFQLEKPRFRMNDDREVNCYALLAEHASGRDVREAAFAAWLEQKEGDEGCFRLASELVAANRLTVEQIWKKARASVEVSKPRAARQAAQLAGPTAAAGIGDALDASARYLARSAATASRAEAELAAIALVRIAGNDPEAAARALEDRWQKALPADLAAWAWTAVARQRASRLDPTAADTYALADRLAGRGARPERLEGRGEGVLSDDALGWKVRAAFRADNGRTRWRQVQEAIAAMSPAEQQDPAWLYWKARATAALAPAGAEGDAQRAASREQLAALARERHFHGLLAAEDLGQPQTLPPKPAPPTAEERAWAKQNIGSVRGLALIQLGLRSEGVREWNFSIRGLDDRQLLAAAQLACDREVWDRCINTSDRTKTEIDMAQRYPMPFRSEVLAQAREAGLDPAYVYGLIRQESRFIMDARSVVGASGLMQLMPATARWTAKKIGLAYTPTQIAERETNLKLGNAYLKLVLDEMGGSEPMAAAAYNAGPGRPRRWREGPTLEPAAWAETIPFAETRDYVKKVLANAVYYAHLLAPTAPAATAATPGASSTAAPPRARGTTVRSRLGRPVGPADPNAPVDRDLP